MTDQSMIERVAQAIAKECPCVDDAHDAARVAIKAVRDALLNHTDEMAQAASDARDRGGRPDIAMLDVALSRPTL